VKLRSVNKNKRGFSTIMALVSGALGLGFLIVFSLIFFTNLTDDGITGSGTAADSSGDRFLGNFSAGVDSISGNLGTVFTIGVFVLIITVLLIAYVFARRNGLMGGGQLG